MTNTIARLLHQLMPTVLGWSEGARLPTHLALKVVLLCRAPGSHEKALVDEHLQALALPQLQQHRSGFAASVRCNKGIIVKAVAVGPAQFGHMFRCWEHKKAMRTPLMDGILRHWLCRSCSSSTQA